MAEPGLTTIHAILIFAGIPAAIYALIALPFLVPVWRRRAKGRRAGQAIETTSGKSAPSIRPSSNGGHDSQDADE